MKISEAIKLMKEIVGYNMEVAIQGKDHGQFVVPYFEGEPGVGKTAIAAQVCREMDIWHNNIIVAQYDPGILSGLDIPDKDENGKMYMKKIRPAYLPNPEIKEQNTGIMCLDELAQGFLMHQNIMAQLVNEWRINRHLIPLGITICATGNSAKHKAGTTPMPAHLKDRLSTFKIENDTEEWLNNFAIPNGLDFRVRSYIREFPGKLQMFDPKADTCPTCRSWDKVSTWMKMGLTGKIRTEAIQATIGNDIGTEFETWLRYEERLPKAEDILKSPLTAPVFDKPKDISLNYLILANLADRANEKNIEPMSKYVTRIPQAELLAWWLKDTLGQHSNLKKNKVITDLKMKHVAKLVAE